MNAFLLLTSALLAGADPSCASAGGSCSNGSCGSVSSCCDSGCDSGCRGGFLAKLRCKFKRNDCCDTCAQPTCAQPVCCKPAPVCHASTCNTCDSCDNGCRGGFLARLKGKFKRDDCCAAPTCHTCAAPTCCAAPVVKHCAPTCHTCAAPSCNTCDDGCHCGFLARLKGKFKRNDCCDTCNSCGTASTCNSCGSAAPAAPAAKTEEKAKEEDGEEGEAKKLPAGKKAARGISVEPPALEVTPAQAIQVEGPKNPFELDRRYEQRVARAADYSSLTGQLFFVHADGGIWVLRYAPLFQEDMNGGGVILARGLRMDSYREGDLVTVKGEILSKQGSKHLGAPLYRAATIQLIDRTSK